MKATYHYKSTPITGVTLELTAEEMHDLQVFVRTVTDEAYNRAVARTLGQSFYAENTYNIYDLLKKLRETTYIPFRMDL